MMQTNYSSTGIPVNKERITEDKSKIEVVEKLVREGRLSLEDGLKLLIERYTDYVYPIAYRNYDITYADGKERVSIY